MKRLSFISCTLLLLRGERDVRHADPYARLYFETWSKHRQGRTVANRQGRRQLAPKHIHSGLCVPGGGGGGHITEIAMVPDSLFLSNSYTVQLLKVRSM